MDNKTIFSKTGKGVLEIKNKAGKLSKDLVKVLSLIDGKSTVADLLAKAKFNDAEINKALSELTTGGYIKEFANTSTGTQADGAGSYVDDLDFTSSLSPGKNVYQNAQTEWRQRETADRTKAEQDTKRKREEDERLKKEQAAKQAAEEGARLTKIEAERKAKEAAGHKVRDETERKAKVQAEVMEQTQRDLSKILEAERKAFELAERKKLEDQHLQTSENAARRAREEAEHRIKEDEARRRSEEEERRSKEEGDRKRAEEDRHRKEEDDRKRKEEEERKRHEVEEREKREAEERKKREEDDRRRREEEERKRKEEEERKRREEEQRKEEERKRAEEQERKRKEDEERKRKEEEERIRAEEERKRKEEEERVRAEEERKRKEEEERRKREDEEKRARREDEDRRRREEDDRRKHEDDEEARSRGEDPVAEREAEERRKREDEERRLRDAEDSKRDEDDRKRRAEEDEDRREREDADRRRRAEAQRREDDERRDREEAAQRREKEERAKQAASAKSDLPEFDLSGLKAMESQVAAEFEKQQEELRKREEEEERQREQEERARLAVERAEREEQAREEAERREADDLERRERMEHERQDREQRERKRQEDKETRTKEQEEAKVKREQERQRQETMKVENERRGREDDLVKRRKEQEERDRKRVEVDSLKKQKGIRSPLDRFKPLVIGVAVLVAVVIGGVQLMPMNSYVPSIEKLASEHIKEPVSIGSMRVSILSGFTIDLKDIKLGTTQDVKIDKVSFSPEFASMFGDVKIIRKVEVESATVAEEVLPRLSKWLEAAVADRNLQISRVVVKSIKLESRAAKVPPFDADLQLSAEGAIEKAVLSSSDGKLNVELTPRDNQIDIALSAAKGWVPPFGPQIEFTDLTASAVATRNQIRVEKFEALLYGGAAKGSAIMVWGGPWTLDGEVATERISLQELMAVFTREAKSTGQMQSKLRYSMSSQGLATLFDSPKIDGTFEIKKGDLDGVDLVRALQSGGRGVTQGGATRFEEIDGALTLANGRYQYRNMKLSAGLLSATGTFEVSPAKDVSGRLAVELRSQAAQIRGNFIVDGDLKAVVLKPN